jgi:hypothetical protein
MESSAAQFDSEFSPYSVVKLHFSGPFSFICHDLLDFGRQLKLLADYRINTRIDAYRIHFSSSQSLNKDQNKYRKD